MVKVKKKSGKMVEYSASKVKSILKTVGFTGKTLVKGTSNVLKEAKKLTKAGVISATNFEKAVVKGVSNTNKIVVSSAQNITKKVLK
ncbi:MAG: hypothetical protein KKF50_05725 [Nanoarchaeota archaeon]|nr:hypothetical protein [Nanoarchaeota archaeon]